MNNVTNRKSNIELLRVFAMIMIIASHCCLHGVINNQLGIADLWVQGGIVNKVVSSSAVLGNIGVGLFFSITGFFSISKERVELKVKLITDVMCFALFNALLLLVLFFSGSEFIDIGGSPELFRTIVRFLLTPITGENWWFITAYIYLALFISPVLNRVIKNTNSGQKLAIVFILLNGMVLSMYIETPVNRLLQAAAYYVLGVALRRNVYFKSEYKRVQLSLITIALFVMHSLSNFILFNSSDHAFQLLFEIVSYTVVEPCLIATIFLLMLNTNIGEKRWINAISATMLGVYLFHDSSVMRRVIWGVLLPMDDIYNSKLFPVALLLIVLVVLFSGISFYQIYSITIQKRAIRVAKKVASKIKHSFLQESEENE